MIALVLAAIVLLVLTVIFANGSQNRKEAERANRQIESGSYAIQMVGDDLRLAGYYAEFDPTALTLPALPSICVTDVAVIGTVLRVPIQGLNEVSSNQTCGSQTLSVLAGNDVLVIRRVATCKAGPTADADCDISGPYFQAASCETTLLSTFPSDSFALVSDASTLSLTKKDCATLADYRGFRTHVYFVAANDKTGDGIPTLKRAELVGNDYTVVALVEGVEQFEVEYGLDTNGDSLPDSWTDAPANVGEWSNVVAARVYVLARNPDKSPGYSDAKSYVMGSKTFTPPTADRGYKRHLYRTEVRLNNVAGRRSS
jgi:hypothetical protein